MYGWCSAGWYLHGKDALIAVFAGVAALLIVVSAALAAPSQKLMVAWAAFGIGFSFAIYAVISTAAVAAFIAAVFSGLLAVACVARRLGVNMLPARCLEVTHRRG